MKKTKLSSVIFLLTLSLIACEDQRSLFAEKIRSYIVKRTNPIKANELVNNFQNKLTILSYTLSLKELEETKIKYDLSDSLVMQIKGAAFARASGVKKIEEKLVLNYFSYEESLGVALKENDGKISFALIKTKSFAKLKTQYEKYTKEKCHRVWIFFKKCHDVEQQRQRELTESEKITVSEATKYSAINSILEAVDILKRGDYELYMSDTGTIFSPDHKSVAHVTYFGNIAIGPSSELKSILPIDYEYQFSYFGLRREQLIKLAKDKDFVFLFGYPSKSLKSNIMKNGKYFKFNYLRKDKKRSTFPTAFVNFAYTESLKGPYVLEVKKNGNVILYSKKDPNVILWTTNTANKGKGPYNLHLTNDKKLILEDSEGKILYQSPDYKEIPTIYYRGTRQKHYQNAINGQLANNNVGNCVDKNGLYIDVESNKYSLNIDISGREKNLNAMDNKNIYIHNSNENYHFDQQCPAKIIMIDLLKVTKVGPKDDDIFDVCFTVKFFGFGWSSFYCNGEIAGYNEQPTQGPGNYISNFIVYIKEKGEPVPDFDLLPKYIPTQDELDDPDFG